MKDTAIKEIEKQQEDLKNSPAFFVGEVLKGLLRKGEGPAEKVVEKLKEKGSLEACVKKLMEEARKNIKDKIGFVPDDKAAEIIRAFYGIGKEERKESKVIDLADFL